MATATLVPPGKLKRSYWVDANGRRVKSATPGAIRKEWVNETYYIQYRERKGGAQRYVAAHRDKRSSEAKMSRLVTGLERGQEGLDDPFQKHRERRATEHLEEFLPVLRQKARSEHYISETERILRKFLERAKVRRLGDLTSECIETYLTGLKGAPGTRRKHYIAASRFVKWLYRRGRIERNLIDHVEAPAQVTIHHYRSLSVDELKALLEAARTRPLREAQTIRRGPRKGQVVGSVKPHVRERLERRGRGLRLLYLMAIYTGLRKGELTRLRVGHIDFDARPCPQVRLPGLLTKNGKAAKPWLPASVANELRKWIEENGLGESDPVFHVPTALHRICSADLKLAGIPKMTERGKASFHSLRTSVNVALKMLGWDASARQMFMRHSDIRLTTNVYDDGNLDDLPEMAQSLEKLELCGTTAV